MRQKAGLGMLGGWVAAAGTALGLGLIASTVQAQDVYELGDGGWESLAVAEPGTPEGALQEARRAFAAERYDQAEDLTRDWIATYPNHPGQADAHLLLADSIAAGGDLFKSLFEYEYVIRVFPSSEHYREAVQREYAIADRFLSGEKRKLWGMKFVTAFSEGEEIMIRVEERMPGTTLGRRAMLRLADYYFADGQMFLASETYDVYLLNYPTSPDREYAMLRLIYAHLARFRGPRYDATGLLDARQVLERFSGEFPAAAARINAEGLLARISDSLAAKQAQTAEWYIRRGERLSAVYVLDRIVRDYPGTPTAIRAAQRLEQLGPVPGLRTVIHSDSDE